MTKIEERIHDAEIGRNRWYRTGPITKWVHDGPPPTLAGLTPTQEVLARVADDYLQWYIVRGMHPDLKCLKELYKITEITLPYVLKIEIHRFGYSVDQIDPRLMRYIKPRGIIGICGE